ncbi:hypothetical protein SMD_3515 [Stenotrophomonas maltophilia D457]|nr:hypothetical protein SMD_3515 [Stenotrophomonas maltophilia D457]
MEGWSPDLRRCGHPGVSGRGHGRWSWGGCARSAPSKARIRRIPRKNRPERSEFRFTETLSAATILVPQAIAPDATETNKNSVARVDIAKTAVFLSITCCITTRHREPTTKPPTSAPPRCVRFLCSYLLPNQQVRDEPACKQRIHRNSSKTRTRPGAGFFISEPGFRRNHHAHRPTQNPDPHRRHASWWLCLRGAWCLLHRFPLTGRYVTSTTGRSFFSSHRKEPPP